MRRYLNYAELQDILFSSLRLILELGFCGYAIWWP
jgi:hypothetical protein